MAISHPLKPIYDAQSKVLILGSFPSPKSREIGFYYGHPQNRFWRILQEVFQAPVGDDATSKTAFLQQHHLAIWDVLASCDIVGASDSSIKNPVGNDFSAILATADIKAVFTTGKKAHALYQKHCYPHTRIPAQVLPSPSAANCARSLEQLAHDYRVLLQYL